MPKFKLSTDLEPLIKTLNFNLVTILIYDGKTVFYKKFQF